MSLFLPILLLGLAQPADQPLTPTPVDTQAQNTEPAFVNPPKFTFPAAKSTVMPKLTFIPGDPLLEDPNLCLTMRTYFFERRDGFAPEFVGMTTCQPAKRSRPKRIFKGKARLVPAN